MSAALREPKAYDRVSFLPVGQLRIDPKYQRNISETRVERMAANFDVAKADTLTVSARDGAFFVLDGQHRLLAARKAGISGLWCLIHTDMTVDEDAALFVALNTERSRPRASEIFRSRLNYDPIAKDIQRVAEEEGWSLRLHHSELIAPRQTTGVGALDKWYAYGGPEFLRTILRVAAVAWPDDADNGRADVLQGIGAFLAIYEKHANFTIARLVEKLSDGSVMGFRQRLLSASRGYSSSTQRSVAVDVILAMYNKGLKSKFLPAFSREERIWKARRHESETEQ